ncbi:hypothetical protein HUJ05_001919 [Dendroctonus ponderosae]|nr:hypothetical protein HUJ05_001919 [Dendroctonus ponderosae]
MPTEDQRDDNPTTKITTEKIIRTEKQLKNRTTNGEDHLPAKINQPFGNQYIDNTRHTIYNAAVIPQGWFTSIFNSI